MREGTAAWTGAQRPAAIFHNRAAGSGRSWRVQRAVDLTRAALDADLHVIDTRDPHEFRAFLEERLAAYRTIVIAGGDGSLGMACNLLAGRSDVALGYLPAGVGNATAHLLRLPRDPVTLAAVVAGGVARPVDLLVVEDRLALFAGAGWDALVAERYAGAGAHRLAGWARAVARSLPDLARRPRVEVEADGRTVHAGPMELLIVGTSPWYGRGLLVNPGASPHRGMLTARIYAGPPHRLALEAGRWMTHRTPATSPIEATSLLVRRTDGRPLAVQADGDPMGRREEWQFGIRPAAVRLIGRW